MKLALRAGSGSVQPMNIELKFRLVSAETELGNILSATIEQPGWKS